LVHHPSTSIITAPLLYRTRLPPIVEDSGLRYPKPRSLSRMHTINKLWRKKRQPLKSLLLPQFLIE
jgi:hypothetical protein